MKNDNLKISLMTVKDLYKIKNILESEFDSFWNYSIFKSELENPNSIYFILQKDDEIIGFIGVLFILDEADITNIVIKQNYRGNGYSKILLKHIINYCKLNKIKKINLEVNSNNSKALNLYKTFGFNQVGCRKKYYIDGDALLMSFNI